MENIKEADLYLPIKAFFIDGGYTVNGEVKDVDMVISKGDELVAIELKKTFNLKLILQATERQRYFDSVYVAIEKPKKTYKNKRYKEIIHLLKRLEIGLITVTFLKSGPNVVIEHHPLEFSHRRQNKKRTIIEMEVKNRSNIMDNIGGTNKQANMTVYREKALFIACLLDRLGTSSPKSLKIYNSEDKTGSILYNNHYQWYERVGKGQYRLSLKGKEAIQTYQEISDYFYHKIEEKQNEN